MKFIKDYTNFSINEAISKDHDKKHGVSKNNKDDEKPHISYAERMRKKMEKEDKEAKLEKTREELETIKAKLANGEKMSKEDYDELQKMDTEESKDLLSKYKDNFKEWLKDELTKKYTGGEISYRH